MKVKKLTAYRKVALARQGSLRAFLPNYDCLCLLLLVVFMPTVSQAVETVCARVKIEIKQELTLERQAFDAQMKPVACATVGWSQVRTASFVLRD
ncbi:MAG: hypothetical protein EXR90_00435 [Methyloglobulus sp.]|nr:hypothetical protein [Methyloglobulus sp.]